MNNELLNLILDIGLYHYLFLALILFMIGFFGAIISKNILKVLISVEFMLTAVNINFIAFASFFDNLKLQGFVFSLFYSHFGYFYSLHWEDYLILFNQEES